jgi:hypothetical protein
MTRHRLSSRTTQRTAVASLERPDIGEIHKPRPVATQHFICAAGLERDTLVRTYRAGSIARIAACGWNAER